MAEFTAITNGDLFGQTTVDYATVHDASNATSVSNDTVFYTGQRKYTSGGNTIWEILRNGLIFNTASIPSSATITSATLSLYGNYDQSGLDFDVVIVDGTDIDNPNVVADYGQLLNETTSWGSMNTSSFLVENWNDITLNATGIAGIVKGGLTRLALRSSRDINSNEPTLTTPLEIVEWYGIDTSGKEPKLTVNYTLAFIPRIFYID